MEKRFKELLRLLKMSDKERYNLMEVRRAYRFAKLAHVGQKRLTGDPFASHLLETAIILASWKLDEPSLIAGLLHDTIEDGGAKRQDIVKDFGEEITVLVDGVSKVSNLKLRGSTEDIFVENLRKMFLAMAKDLRVILIKLADRLHNMRTLYALPKEKQGRIARETLEVFAPLAERLGMGEVKAELDDLAFPYVYPEDFEKVKKESRIHYKKAEGHIKIMKENLLKETHKEKLKVKIDGRKKHLYSLYLKLKRSEINWDYEKIHDIVALRMLVTTIPECYSALGTVHRLYKPVPHLGISDFIAQPKPNGYRSVHTKVFGPEGRIVEVQIRTYDMHEEAEHGIAAHWAYSEVKRKTNVSEELLEKSGVKTSQEKLSWVKQLAKWQEELTDSREFLQAVKFDALSERIFIFSPKGDVYELPVGATPVDFAASVHTGLLKYIKGARIDGKVAPLDYKLKSGQIVEILKTREERKPNSDWLTFVKTNLAKGEIEKYLRKASKKI